MLIGKSIKHFRKKLGFTQSKLAKKAGTTQTYLSQVESDSRSPHKSTLRSICNSLNIPESFLYMYSLDTDDIVETKRPAFDLIKHSMKGLIDDTIEELINSNKK